MGTYSLDFLCWINLCLFRDDFLRELESIGVSRDTALRLAYFSDDLDILKLYKENVNDTEAKEAISLYLSYMLSKWTGE